MTVEHVRSLMGRYSVPLLLIMSPTDLRYVTGVGFSRGALLITPSKALLVVDQRYALRAAALQSLFEVAVLPVGASIYHVLDGALKEIQGPVCFDPTTMTVEAYEELCVHAPCRAAPELFAHLRRPKRPEEIQTIEKACDLCQKGFEYLYTQIREGVTEEELVQALKLFWLAGGAEGVSFEPIIAFGPNSACPHWAPSSTPLKNHSIILIDIGVKNHSYHSDMTRTVFFGQPDPQLLKWHDMVREAYGLALAHARPNVLPVDLDRMVRDFLASKGYKEAFLHGLGHGVGLEVHEAPRISPTAKEAAAFEVGDVIAIEPGLYVPEKGGVRIENTVVVGPEGGRSLSSLSIEPLVL